MNENNKHGNIIKKSKCRNTDLAGGLRSFNNPYIIIHVHFFLQKISSMKLVFFSKIRVIKKPNVLI